MPPRIRSLKPDCWQDTGLGRCSMQARLLFVGLITQADDAGRLPAEPALLRSQVFPFDAELELDTISEWLAELEAQKLVLLYAKDGTSYAALRSWERHQKINRRSPSRHPAPPRGKRSLKAHGGLTEASPPDRRGEDRIGGDGSKSSSALTRADSPLSFELADLVEQNGSKRPEVTKRWADAERLLLDADGRDWAEARSVLRWCQRDEFWRSNVLSMPKFREKYDTLRLQMRRKASSVDEAIQRDLAIARGEVAA